MSFIQEILERSIFHSIMDILVADAYLPDYRDEVTYPNNPTGQTAYQSALDAIKTDKGFFVKMYGAGNNQAKGSKDVPRIVISSTSYIPGTIGRDSVVTYKPGQANNTFDTYTMNSQRSTDFEFSVYLVANKQEHIRLLYDIIFRAITPRGYMPFYNVPDNPNFFCEFITDWDTPDLERGLIEKVLRFSVTDLYIIDEQLVNSAIPAITDIKLNGSGVDGVPQSSNLQFPDGLIDNDLILDNNLIFG